MAKGGIKAAVAGGQGGGGGIESIFGTDADDELIAGAGRQKIEGGAGNDLLDGGSGNDILKGGDGDDVIIGGLGADHMWGGAGSDTFVYNSLLEGEGDMVKDFDAGVGGDVIDLSALVTSGEILSADVYQKGDDLVVTVTNPDGAVSDFMVLNSVSLADWSSENIFLEAPETIIAATYDNEYIILGPSFGPEDGVTEITADGHTGVVIQGTAGDDYLDFSATTLTGIANITGEGGNDTIIGSAGDDMITGADGDDILNGGGGDDILFGLLGADTYVVGLNSGTDVYSDTGNDGSWDKVIAETDGVTIQMTTYISLFQGIEEFSADGHTGVTISGTDGADNLWFIGDTLTGIESIDGQGGNDFIIGSDGSDTITGGAGADTINGGGGADTITGGAGADTMYGGAGADTFVYGAYSNGEGGDTIVDYTAADGDTLDLSALVASAEVDSYTLTQVGADTTVVLNLSGGGTEDYVTLLDTATGDVMII